MSPLPGRAPRFGEGLFESVLLGVDLVVEKLLRQFISIVDLQLKDQTSEETFSSVSLQTLSPHIFATPPSLL